MDRLLENRILRILLPVKKTAAGSEKNQYGTRNPKKSA
jgi:hypothetical protein